MPCVGTSSTCRAQSSPWLSRELGAFLQSILTQQLGLLLLKKNKCLPHSATVPSNSFQMYNNLPDLSQIFSVAVNTEKCILVLE